MAVPIVKPSLPSNLPMIWWQCLLSNRLFYPTSQWHDGSAYCQTVSSIQPPNDMMAVPILKLSILSNLPMTWLQCLLSNLSLPSNLRITWLQCLLSNFSLPSNLPMAWWQCFCQTSLFHPASQWHDGSAYTSPTDCQLDTFSPRSLAEWSKYMQLCDRQFQKYRTTCNLLVMFREARIMSKYSAFQRDSFFPVVRPVCFRRVRGRSCLYSIDRPGHACQKSPACCIRSKTAAHAAST